MSDFSAKARLLTAFLVLAAFATSVAAQSVLYDLTTDHPAGIGRAVASAGDVNGDGFPDFIVGMPYDDTVGTNAGAARVYSGRDGSVLYTFYPPPANFRSFGSTVAGAGDVNGDGYADLIVGEELAAFGQAFVFSGRDGSLLYTFTGAEYDFLGTAVAGAGDVDGDGYDDVIVGAPQSETFHPNVGYATVYSGRNGSVLYQWNGCGVGDAFGLAVGKAGDVDADGFTDVIVYTAEPAETGCSPSAQVFSGRDGSLLYSVPAGDVITAGPRIVNGAGDVNGDGYADFVVGDIPGNQCQGNLPGEVKVYSGRDGSLLHDFPGAPGCTSFGWSVACAGDIDGDGHADIVAGAVGGKYAEVYSGLGGTLLAHVEWNEVDFGWAVDGLGDVNGDGYPEFIVGGSAGDHAIVYTMRPESPSTPFCFGDGTSSACPCGNSGSAGHGCQNSAGTGGARLTMSGIAGLSADTVRFTSSGELPSALSILLQGSTAIAPVHFGDGLRCAGGMLKRLYAKNASAGVVVVPQSGDLSVSVRSTRLGDPIVQGATRNYQMYYRDPSAGFCPAGTSNASNAVAVVWEF